MFCYELLFMASCYSLYPSWQERAVPARLCDCDGYLQSRADTVLAAAGHHAAGQSSWTPERKKVTKRACSWFKTARLGCCTLATERSASKNWHHLLRQGKSFSHVPNQGPFIDSKFEAPWATETTALKTRRQQEDRSTVQCECQGISLAPVLWQDPLAEPPQLCGSCPPYLTAIHGICQAPQLPIGHGHVVLAHGTVLQAPALPVIIHQLSSFTWEKQGFLVVLEGRQAHRQQSQQK